MKVGVTGTRMGMTQHQKEQFALKIHELNTTEFHHGDCMGADAESHDIIRAIFPHIKIIVHPPLSDYMRAFKQGNETRTAYDYIPRDKNIVDETDFLIGAPLTNDEVIRSGTWTTIRYARKTNKPHKILER